VWTTRVPDLSHPDICVFDLDPSEEEPKPLRAAALALRDLLEELGLPSWVKTSGSKGFHIVVPLTARRRWAMSRASRIVSARCSSRAIPIT
jgi:bifunctional non-homologous end joining protein LigD